MARSLDSGKAVAWRRRVGRFGRSGLTVVRFCKEEGVSTASFYRWRNKLADKTPAMRHADRTPAFQAVRVTSVHAPITIHLPGDVRMEVPTDNLDTVQLVLSELLRQDAMRDRGDSPC